MPTYAATSQTAEMQDEFICHRDPKASHRLVLLHGWGADAEDLINLGDAVVRDLEEPFEVISLRAPQKHPEGIGRQWYGLYPPEWSAAELAISDLKRRLKTFETSSIPLSKTFLLGFSQGGAMGLAAGCDLCLGGLICCSSYPHPSWMPPSTRPPVLLSHGNNDQVVPIEASRKLLSTLKTSLAEVDLLIFEGNHEIPLQLISRFQLALKTWIN